MATRPLQWVMLDRVNQNGIITHPQMQDERSHFLGNSFCSTKKERSVISHSLPVLFHLTRYFTVQQPQAFLLL